MIRITKHGDSTDISFELPKVARIIIALFAFFVAIVAVYFRYFA